MHAAVKAVVLVLVLVVIGAGVVYTSYTHTAAVNTTILIEVSERNAVVVLRLTTHVRTRSRRMIRPPSCQPMTRW